MTGTPRTPRVRPTPKAEETRRRILSAALTLFRTRGFAETTIRDIARSAQVATGAAYYYFPLKEAIVMAFYWELHAEFDVISRRRLQNIRDLRGRVHALIDAKLEQFGPYRDLFRALFKSAGDPASPLSPFGEETREMREQSIEQFRDAIDGSNARIPRDISPELPTLFWLYQMGIVLFWIHDRSPRQQRTRRLLDQSLDAIVKLIQISRFPLMAPIRRAAVRLIREMTESTEVEESR